MKHNCSLHSVSVALRPGCEVTFRVRTSPGCPVSFNTVFDQTVSRVAPEGAGLIRRAKCCMPFSYGATGVEMLLTRAQVLLS